MGGGSLVLMVAMMVLMCGGMMTAGVLAIRAWRRTPGRGADPVGDAQRGVVDTAVAAQTDDDAESG